MIQRVRVSSAARLVQGPADDLERLVDLGLADHQRRQQRRVSAPIG